jgi:hypothetical protein
MGVPIFTTDPGYGYQPKSDYAALSEDTAAPHGLTAAAILASPPTPLVCQWRQPPPRDGELRWPLPQSVFVALPRIAVIGGTGVNIRLSTAADD